MSARPRLRSPGAARALHRSDRAAAAHLDAHHNVQRDHRLLPAFLAVADSYELPLRGHCGVRHIPSFYGQWDGETDLEQVGPQALARIVATEVKEGFNELCCHPGYPDAELASSYTLERQSRAHHAVRSRLPAPSRGTRGRARQLPRPGSAVTRVLLATVRLLRVPRGRRPFLGVMQYAHTPPQARMRGLSPRQLHMD